jgi:hypothetical protein
MKMYRFIAGLLLCLGGLAIIVTAGLVKPPLDLPYDQWKARIAPVHLCWMLGSTLCLIGVVVILKEMFSRNQAAESIEREEMALREEILESLSRARLNQQELSELIVNRYGTTGLIGLNLNQLKQLRDNIVRRMSEIE